MSDLKQAVIIEDDRLSAKVLETLLKQQGMSVIVIADPALTSSVLAGITTPDVIFVDLEMPHLDGYQVLALLHAQIPIHVPIAAYTANTGQMVIAMDKGFNGFFAKPINSATFPENLAQLLRGEKVLSI